MQPSIVVLSLPPNAIARQTLPINVHPAISTPLLYPLLPLLQIPQPRRTNSPLPTLTLHPRPHNLILVDVAHSFLIPFRCEVGRV